MCACDLPYLVFPISVYTSLPLGHPLGLRVNKQQHIVCSQKSESWEEVHIEFGSKHGPFVQEIPGSIRVE